MLDPYRKDPEVEVRFHPHLRLLWADGPTGATVARLRFSSSRTIDRGVKRFQGQGVEGRAGPKPGRPCRFAAEGIAVRVEWVTTTASTAFGFLPSRWGGEAVALLRLERPQVEVSPETGRRGLHPGNLVYRRPPPVLQPTDPERQGQLNPLPAQRAGWPEEETAVFPDKVDIPTNPKSGGMGMSKGPPATVLTPGNNKTRSLAGSLPWRTGQVFLTEGRPKQGRDTALLLASLDDVRGRLRRYRKIQGLCDQAKGPTSEEVTVYRWDHRERIELHLLPKSSPDGHPIEGVWWHLPEEITRHHRCQTMPEWLDLRFAWLRSRTPLKGEGSVYTIRAAA